MVARRSTAGAIPSEHGHFDDSIEWRKGACGGGEDIARHRDGRKRQMLGATSIIFDPSDAVAEMIDHTRLGQFARTESPIIGVLFHAHGCVPEDKEPWRIIRLDERVEREAGAL